MINQAGVNGPEAYLKTKDFFDLYTDIFNQQGGTKLRPEEIVLVDIEE